MNVLLLMFKFIKQIDHVLFDAYAVKQKSMNTFSLRKHTRSGPNINIKKVLCSHVYVSVILMISRFP